MKPNLIFILIFLINLISFGWQEEPHSPSSLTYEFMEAAANDNFDRVRDLNFFYGEYVDINANHKFNDPTFTAKQPILHYLIRLNKNKMLQELIYYPNIEINKSDDIFQKTPIEWAIYYSNNFAIEILLNHSGTNIHKNNQLNFQFKLLKIKNNCEAIKLLQQHIKRKNELKLELKQILNNDISPIIEEYLDQKLTPEQVIAEQEILNFVIPAPDPIPDSNQTNHECCTIL